ncbi:MAG: hypothetical protein LUD39_05890 [Opitutae bacterium]|nr:hypothetical protein [Opitutae bacterium]MCD8299268.1 hypothetical protein [Opitutae bacterium]
MKRVALLLLGLIFSCLFLSCSKPMPKHGIDVYLEASSKSGAFGSHQTIVMPVTGSTAKVITMPILDIDAFTNVELKQMDYPQLGIYAQPGLRMRIKRDKVVKIYQASGEALAEGAGQKRFFLIVDGNPIGYCRIWSQIREDDLFFVIDSYKEGKELADELAELRFTLNEYILERREYMKERGR